MAATLGPLTAEAERHRMSRPVSTGSPCQLTAIAARLGGYLCAHCRAHHALGGSAAPGVGRIDRAFRRTMVWSRDRDCDQDGVRRAVPRETGGDPGAVRAHVKWDLPGQAGRAGTALGLLITQRSRVQIPPPLLISAGQGPFPAGRGPLA